MTDSLKFSRYALEACSSSNDNMSSDSRASSSDNMAEISHSEVKATLTASEVKQLLDRRIKALEERAEFSKQALLDGLEERKKLMDEIYTRLQFIRHSLSVENQETEQKSSQGPLIYNSCKPNQKGRTRNGLSQVLDQEAQLIAREVKVNTKAFHDHHQPFLDSSRKMMPQH
ncbi:Serine--tRNA ligase [Heracleum sosnowskyi]|uniref:Serine--tRNA ligase n=1 Tax=Heracleum sosnowskyi TaxID=360622 RepID=A0AAD8HCH4_9APIA|nr:Serine--tRNA ligase [Heracleum sosnowskyi]